MNRPFDDQSRERVRLESEAVLAILARVGRGSIEMITSEVAEYELSRIPDPIRRAEVEGLLEVATESIEMTDAVERRGAELAGMGFQVMDALHVACAEAGGATVLFTTDDDLIRRAVKHDMILAVAVENPAAWLMRRLGHGDSRSDPDEH